MAKNIFFFCASTFSYLLYSSESAPCLSFEPVEMTDVGSEMFIYLTIFDSDVFAVNNYNLIMS